MPTNLSNWSINMLKEDNLSWYKWYVLGRWSEVSERQPYFCVGKYVHETIETYHRLWHWNTDRFVTELKLEFVKEWQDEETTERALSEYSHAIDNAKLVVTQRSENPEKQMLRDINAKYRLKCKLDVLRPDFIQDYKVVSSFTKDEDKEKFHQQACLYQYAVYKETGERMVCVMTEILKKKPSLPTKKADLLDMVEEKDKEEMSSKKVADIKNYLYLRTNAEQVSKDHVFEWNDKIIDFAEDLIRKAIIKAEWLKTLNESDIL